MLSEMIRRASRTIAGKCKVVIVDERPRSKYICSVQRALSCAKRSFQFDIGNRSLYVEAYACHTKITKCFFVKSLLIAVIIIF